MHASYGQHRLSFFLFLSFLIPRCMQMLEGKHHQECVRAAALMCGGKHTMLAPFPHSKSHPLPFKCAITFSELKHEHCLHQSSAAIMYKYYSMLILLSQSDVAFLSAEAHHLPWNDLAVLCHHLPSSSCRYL